MPKRRIPEPITTQLGFPVSDTHGCREKGEKGTLRLHWQRSGLRRSILGGVMALRGWMMDDQVTVAQFKRAVIDFQGRDARVHRRREREQKRQAERDEQIKAQERLAQELAKKAKREAAKSSQKGKEVGNGSSS